eukprot:m.292556 g.292556  ORF g.292556 m.292556 type:complete len:527 (-) comp20003_c0_seq1:386-1966(-)
MMISQTMSDTASIGGPEPSVREITKPEKTRTTLGLVVIGFFWTSGGFYGTEICMNGPPFWILVLCLAMPLLYSLPTALISAELATNYPETGGQCVYVTLACGSLIGAHNTWWVWFSTAVDAGTYPQFIQQSIQQQFPGEIPDEVCEYIPLMVIAFITTINLLGVDWLIRFEIFLGAMAALPCLVFLGYGLPDIKFKPLMDKSGSMPLAAMVSNSLWLYGGFTNLGVLAGECKTPRRSYLFAVAILVPLKILLRFVPFVIAFSIGVPRDATDEAGFFLTLCDDIAGNWLKWWYFAGSIVCFLGFYNAMAVNAERTAFYFIEERYSDTLDRWSKSSYVGQFLFIMPPKGGIRRVYILTVALLECAMVRIDAPLLLQLEMLIYALSAGLFFYSFVYLRLQRTRKFKASRTDPDVAPLLRANDGNLVKPVGLEQGDVKGGDSVDNSEEVYNIGGGNVVAFSMILFPVIAFGMNTVLNFIDKGSKEDGSPFPYFKMVCFVGIIAIGVVANLISNCVERGDYRKIMLAPTYE